jgi:septum formation protein
VETSKIVNSSDDVAESQIQAVPEFILASSSPRRRQLLQDAGYRFQVVAPTIPEPDEAFSGLSPAQQAESLAYFKARVVSDLHPGRYVVGADTIVALGDKVLGKPDDADHARTMLQNLSGTRHRVITGVAVLAADGRRIIASDITYVTMRPLTPDEIERYIASGEWIGKAGAYAIQETADRFVQGVQGSFSNIVGLPMELLARMLERIK